MMRDVCPFGAELEFSHRRCSQEPVWIENNFINTSIFLFLYTKRFSDLNEKEWVGKMNMFYTIEPTVYNAFDSIHIDFELTDKKLVYKILL